MRRASSAAGGCRSRPSRARGTPWRSSGMHATWSPPAAVRVGVPEQPGDLLVAGSVALDTRDGPFGKVDQTLGGSALYFALAASLVRPVKVVAPVGVDGANRVAHAFSCHTIDFEMLQR